MTWNYRVIQFIEYDGPWNAIHEVHYDDAGIPAAYGENHAVVIGDSIEELRTVIKNMESALDKPILVETDFIGDEDQI